MKFSLADSLRRVAGLKQGGGAIDAGGALQRLLDGATPQALRSVIGEALKPGVLGWPGGAARRAADTGEGQFLAKTYDDARAGSRQYKLYVPGGYNGRRVPLIVMLHGCTQSPDDFATGTRMNLAAEAQTCLVAYPAQTSAANGQKCWNWFNRAEQQRDGGEPSLIAGITGEVMRDYAVDPARVYVAGLSAGGAAAAIMGETYPELYAAIGVHSGLACGAARDLRSAFAAMQRGAVAAPSERKRLVPTIVFHGERDTTVHPRNGDAVVAQSVMARPLRTRTETGIAPGGRGYSRTLHIAPDGTVVVEQWVVQGAGHAWCGGSAAGSFTDPHGPDATGEMLRFFLGHRQA